MKNFTLLLLFFTINIFSQVGINTVTPDASSILDVTSTNKGVLIPRIPLLSTTDVATIVSPLTSLLIYNTATVADVTPGYYYWDGLEWAKLSTVSASDTWGLLGNAGSDETINFIGTTDNQDLVFKRNNAMAGLLDTSNSAFGVNALAVNTGLRNTANGVNALLSNLGGTNNTASGHNALSSNIDGNNNTAIGRNSLTTNTSGLNNTASGANTLSSNVGGINNVANGVNALSANVNGNNNAAFGVNALFSNIDGSNNTATGRSSLLTNTSGINNTATGFNALGGNLTGTNNTANGVNALSINSIGINNTAVGSNSLRDNTEGFNTAIGVNSLLVSTIGIGNTASGYLSLRFNTEGSYNTATGYQSLRLNTTGDNNTGIGYRALDNVTTGSNNTAIGYLSQVPDPTLDNQVRIGNTAITYAGVQVAWTITSDKRFKNNIENSNLGLEFINQLRPVSYYRNNDESNKTEYGFIAQELKEVLKNNDGENSGIVSEDSEGMLSVRYNDLLAPIVKAIQEQTEEIKSLKSENKALKLKLETIEKELKK